MLKPIKFRDFASLFIILLVSFFLGEEAIRFYGRFFPVEYGGLVAFIEGFVLSCYALTGLLYGYKYKIWYHNLLFVIFLLPLVALGVVMIRSDDAYLLLPLLLVTYILGYLANKFWVAAR